MWILVHSWELRLVDWWAVPVLGLEGCKPVEQLGSQDKALELGTLVRTIINLCCRLYRGALQFDKPLVQ